MAEAGGSENTNVPTRLIPEVIGMCADLLGKLDSTMSRPQFPFGYREGGSWHINGEANSGSFWHELEVGDGPPLNLQLFRWNSIRPPRTLKELNKQRFSWPCSLSIEHPAIATDSLNARSALSHSPDAGYYEIRPVRKRSPKMQLHVYASTAEALLQDTGTGDVRGLCTALEKAISKRPPTSEHTNRECALTVSRNGSYHMTRVLGETSAQTSACGTWNKQSHLEIAISSILRFRAWWSTGTDTSNAPLRVEYGTAETQADGFPPFVPKPDFDSNDKALVENNTLSLLGRYAQHFVVPPRRRVR